MVKKIITIIALIALGASLFFMPSIFSAVKVFAPKPMAAAPMPDPEPVPTLPGGLETIGGGLTAEEPKMDMEPVAKSPLLDAVQTTKTIVDLVVEMLQKLLGLALAAIGVIKTAQEINKKGKKKSIKT